jgi:hypothetical protein
VYTAILAAGMVCGTRIDILEWRVVEAQYKTNQLVGLGVAGVTVFGKWGAVERNGRSNSAESYFLCQWKWCKGIMLKLT